MSTFGEMVDRRQRRLRRRSLVVGSVLGTVLVLLVLTGFSWVQYRELPWSTYPRFLHWCGREYQPTPGEVGRSEVDGLQRIGSVPGWLNSGEVWGSGTRCPLMDLAIRGDDDRFKFYVLEGGP